MDLSIRWMLRRDRPEVFSIERLSFEFSWSERDFSGALQMPNANAMVAECGGRVVGFVVYELAKTRIRILNLAVDPEMRRRGVGRALASAIVAKLPKDGRKRITLEVRETNLAAQLFFRACGFRAESVIRGFYTGTDEDAFLMVYRVGRCCARVLSETRT